MIKDEIWLPFHLFNTTNRTNIPLSGQHPTLNIPSELLIDFVALPSPSPNLWYCWRRRRF